MKPKYRIYREGNEGRFYIKQKGFLGLWLIVDALLAGKHYVTHYFDTLEQAEKYIENNEKKNEPIKHKLIKEISVPLKH